MSGRVWTCPDVSGRVWTCLDVSGRVWTCPDEASGRSGCAIADWSTAGSFFFSLENQATSCGLCLRFVGCFAVVVVVVRRSCLPLVLISSLNKKNEAIGHWLAVHGAHQSAATLSCCRVAVVAAVFSAIWLRSGSLFVFLFGAVSCLMFG